MNEIEDIKKRVDVVDLISSYLTLKKAGVNYRAVCPFHNEKTPSLMVSPEKQIWHCFGCSEGGDIFSFIMKMENLEFYEALKMLADRAGVKLESRKSISSTKENVDRKSRLYEINALSARVFHKILTSHPSGKMALKYLKDRKLTDETIKEFMIGYAPSSRAMKEYLSKRGFTEEELKNAGNPDRFFKRIMFPIRDVIGNVVAFTGRVIYPRQEPKYLNTAETVIFHKSRLLYNLNNARGEIKTQKATIVVEGQMDVIASHQADIKNVVASSGTALTKDHLQILNRYSPNIIFAFDFDNAGLTSAKKAYEMAIEGGMNVKMIPPVGAYKDPGEIIADNPPGDKTGPKLWSEAVENAKSVIDWYFELAFAKQLTTNNKPQTTSNEQQELTSTEKKEIAKEILPVIKKIPDTIEQAHYVGLLAKRLSLSETVIFDALKKEKGPKKLPEVKKTPEQSIKIPSPELLLGILLYRPEKLAKIAGKIADNDFLVPELSLIYNKLIKVYNEVKVELKSENNRNELIKQLKLQLNRQEQLKVDELILVTADLEKSEKDIDEDFEITLNNLKTNKKEILKQYYADEIKKAESCKDLVKLKKLIKEFQDAI